MRQMACCSSVWGCFSLAPLHKRQSAAGDQIILPEPRTPPEGCLSAKQQPCENLQPPCAKCKAEKGSGSLRGSGLTFAYCNSPFSYQLQFQLGRTGKIRGLRALCSSTRTQGSSFIVFNCQEVGLLHSSLHSSHPELLPSSSVSPWAGRGQEPQFGLSWVKQGVGIFVSQVQSVLTDMQVNLPQLLILHVNLLSMSVSSIHIDGCVGTDMCMHSVMQLLH